MDQPPRHEVGPRHEDPSRHEDVARREDVPRLLVVPAGHTVEGQVRNLQARTEQRGQSEYESVWTFRLERYDAAGQRVTLVPVEMRGISFEGGLGEGDWVRAHGTMKAGTFRVKRVENETTGAVVTAKGIPKVLLVIAGVFFAAIVLWIAYIAFQLITAPTGPPPDWPPSDFPT
ncbi:hypothetical protein ACODT3_39375 [Streptomyces sp. 4.24]|uniref:hypothetical protein n=1 Tax=Streptomyces tritrimontium TaxID=3406573 RepID=UPI003BB66B38